MRPEPLHLAEVLDEGLRIPRRAGRNRARQILGNRRGEPRRVGDDVGDAIEGLSHPATIERECDNRGDD
jgi:hypothetical protein